MVDSQEIRFFPIFRGSFCWGSSELCRKVINPSWLGMVTTHKNAELGMVYYWFIIGDGLLLVTIKILLLVYYWSPPKFTKILRFLLWINKLFGWKHPGKFGFYSPKCGFYHAALRRAYDPGKKELDIMVWWWRWWWCPIVPLSQKNSAGDFKKKWGHFGHHQRIELAQRGASRASMSLTWSASVHSVLRCTCFWILP